MPVIRSDEECSDNGTSHTMWCHFKTTPLMCTYLVGIVGIDVHRSTDDPNSSFDVWCRWDLKPKITFAQSIADMIGNQLFRCVVHKHFLEAAEDRHYRGTKLRSGQLEYLGNPAFEVIFNVIARQ